MQLAANETQRRTAVPQPKVAATMAVRADDRLADACNALAVLGDAVAVIDRRGRVLRWASAAWLALQPSLTVGTTLVALEQALPGLEAARASDHGIGACRWAKASNGTRNSRCWMPITWCCG
jgi:hypothetical protein